MNSTLGKRISTLRHENKLKQDELAEMLGGSAQAVSKWENDQTCPDISLLPHLAKILGVSVDRLLTGKDDVPDVRMLPEIENGDILAIHDAGAHGFAMGYNYNGKLKSAEILLKTDGSTQLIRRAETPADYFATFDCFEELSCLTK